MLWEVEIRPAGGYPDHEAARVLGEAADLGLRRDLRAVARRGYLLEGSCDVGLLTQLARTVLADEIVERVAVGRLGDASLLEAPPGCAQLAYVVFRPGVMDPVAETALQTLRDLGLSVEAVRTFRKYWFSALEEAERRLLATKVLANDCIEQVTWGPLLLDRLQLGSSYQFRRNHVPLCHLDEAQLDRLSRDGQLYLSRAEMVAIRDYYRKLGRDPTDVELETLAQTWSEHCSHKTLTGPIVYCDERGEQQFENLLKETIFAATYTLRQRWADSDWCVSVFRDNAGVIQFDDQYDIVFKVETHNHPSAIEPYGGANTGIGGVIRDPLGTGRGAKPICNTDVFCFAPPDTSYDQLPPGVLHPRRVMKGVVAGVRDYGNRMGIPTVNGAICFDPRYLANPLVYCGTVGLLPKQYREKAPQPGDYIVVVGGRTGRDGIHGATFSSAELSSQSEVVSSGAVQIGNAITQKMLLDVLLAARDRNLYHALTDCGAGGFSSAVGEMADGLGAVVWLERVPLKYQGLSYTEIWISESQERMVLAVPEDCWEEFQRLCASEDVEATVIGRFERTGRLRLYYDGHEVADLDLNFLHRGRPRMVRQATYRPADQQDFHFSNESLRHHTSTLLRILGSLNVASKEWVIRQYDHEVQGGSVVKPLVGVQQDGPSDAAVLRPRLDSYQGVAVGCGLNPLYADYDTYCMAASAIDEAVRNVVAVGADPSRIAILDNFCWGYTDRPETLGALVRAALACRDVAIGLETPFISGKDSLNNEFSYEKNGHRQTIRIPPTLLISAVGIVPDVQRCVTMDVKEPGNRIFLIGYTQAAWGGSHFALVHGLRGGRAPTVDCRLARAIFLAIYQAIQRGLLRACHDVSEGGLAVAVAEMAFAGGWGMELTLPDAATTGTFGVPVIDAVSDTEQLLATWLFAESNSRFVCEVPPQHVSAFCEIFEGLPVVELGHVVEQPWLRISTADGARLVDASLASLKEAWQAPLRW